MKNIAPILVSGLILITQSQVYGDEFPCDVAPETEKIWISTVQKAADSYHPFTHAEYSFDFQGFTTSTNELSEKLSLLLLPVTLLREEDANPEVKDVTCRIRLDVNADISTFKFHKSHLELSCHELIDAVAKETGNEMVIVYDANEYAVVYKIIASQRVEPIPLDADQTSQTNKTESAHP